MAWTHWLRGLLAAAIAGAAGGASLLLIDPANFNLVNGCAIKLGELSAVFALVGIVAYLKQHPVPEDPKQ